MTINFETKIKIDPVRSENREESDESHEATLDLFRKKRLLVLTHSFQSFEKDQIEALSSHFEHVTVMVRYKPVAEISRVLPWLGMIEHQKRNLINTTDLPLNISVIPVPVFYLPTDRSYRNLARQQSRRCLNIIRRRQIRFDIVHAHFTTSSGEVGRALKQHFGVPLLITGHGYDVYDLPFRNSAWYETIRDTCNSAEAVITVSHRNRDCLRDIGVTSPIYILPNGYRQALFQPIERDEARRRVGISPSSDPIVVSVGVLKFVKGHDVLIDAAAWVLRRQPRARFYLIGEGPRRKVLGKQVRALGLESRITFVGWQPHSQINAWLNAADLFVLPSRDEGNPTVLFECLATGTPFIGTCVGGVPEIIDSDAYGLLVPAGEHQSLANAIIEGLQRPWQREEIIRHGQSYSWEKICQSILKIYRSCLSPNRESTHDIGKHS